MNRDWELKIEELGALAARLKANIDDLRRPLVIEFSGTPKAGKSTCVAALAKFFRRHKIPVFVVVERASVCPLSNKSHPFFNIWTAATSLAQLLEGMERNASVVILDRGIFDALVWMHLHLRRDALDESEVEAIASFLTLEPWRDLITVVAALSVSPDKALEREYKDQIVKLDGSVMNETTLTEYNESLTLCRKRYAPMFNILDIDTSERAVLDGVVTIASQVLSLADEVLDEEVAVVDREYVRAHVPPTGVLSDPSAIETFIVGLRDKIRWMRRTVAEATPTLVQPIPAAVFQVGESQVLTCHIRGAKHGRLADTHTVWVGGHLRGSDAKRSRGPTALFKRCLSRELAEELQTRIKPAQLPDFPGVIVWDDTQEHSIQHMGLLFECKNETHVKDIWRFHQREFWENQGKSMFTQVATVDAELAKLPNWERWSVLYLEERYGADFPRDTRQRVLF
jgi:predicted NUDIX family phosphoesterase/thymidylate kinase